MELSILSEIAETGDISNEKKRSKSKNKVKKIKTGSVEEGEIKGKYFDDDEEFDLDNSDDLNRFINKYEDILFKESDDPTKKMDKDDISLLLKQ
jgi:hypothetical protein